MLAKIKVSSRLRHEISTPRGKISNVTFGPNQNLHGDGLPGGISIFTDAESTFERLGAVSDQKEGSDMLTVGGIERRVAGACAQKRELGKKARASLIGQGAVEEVDVWECFRATHAALFLSASFHPETTVHWPNQVRFSRTLELCSRASYCTDKVAQNSAIGFSVADYSGTGSQFAGGRMMCAFALRRTSEPEPIMCPCMRETKVCDSCTCAKLRCMTRGRVQNQGV